jgi:hypothetical protein
LTTFERDITKLPKWAQEFIINLQNALSNANQRIEILSSGHPGTNMSIRAHYGEPDFELPPDSLVTFWTEPEPTVPRRLRDGIEVHLTRDAYGAHIYVSSRNGRIEVLPQASNSVRIRSKQ